MQSPKIIEKQATIKNESIRRLSLIKESQSGTSMVNMIPEPNRIEDQSNSSDDILNEIVPTRMSSNPNI